MGLSVTVLNGMVFTIDFPGTMWVFSSDPAGDFADHSLVFYRVRRSTANLTIATSPMRACALHRVFRALQQKVVA